MQGLINLMDEQQCQLMYKLEDFEREITRYKQEPDFNSDLEPYLKVCEKAVQDFKHNVLLDQTVGFESLKALLSSSVLPKKLKVTELGDKLTRFKGKGKRIEGLELKIHAVLQTGDQDNYFNKEDYQKEGKNISFLDYLNLFQESNVNHDYETLTSLKTRAVIQGKNLSRKLIHVIFMMSMCGEIMFKLEALGDSLSWIGEGENTVVVKRFIDLLHAADDVMVKKIKESLKGEAVVMLDETKAAEHDHSDDLIFLLLKEICRLELFWTRRALPDPEMSTMEDAFLSMASDMRDCEEGLEMFKTHFIELVQEGAFGFEEEDFLTMKQKDEYKAMELEMNKLWNRIEESEKKG
ncbi:uncharacterized protein LOC126653901 [Mercurialis annua]|uniref:uncharacterized protein LOC126653901 n=1 Tax=Mercurialis annua TaxID=3986 RepID=UPI00215F90C7|nr:uncharacterized protein LOC126653901 [Mercurialis annua]